MEYVYQGGCIKLKELETLGDSVTLHQMLECFAVTSLGPYVWIIRIIKMDKMDSDSTEVL